MISTQYSQIQYLRGILQKYPDQDFKFFTFPGTPSFATTGTVVLDVSDVEEAFGQL